MIQRIQTVYLLLVVAIGMAMFFVPIYKVQTPDNIGLPGINNAQDHTLNNLMYLDLNLEMSHGHDSYGTSERNHAMRIVDLAIMLLALVCMFMFKNRARQLLFTRFLMVFSIIFVGLVWYCIISLRSTSQISPNQVQGFLTGAWLPILSPILLFLASRGIAKDIKLVKASDRLR